MSTDETLNDALSSIHDEKKSAPQAPEPLEPGGESTVDGKPQIKGLDLYRQTLEKIKKQNGDIDTDVLALRLYKEFYDILSGGEGSKAASLRRKIMTTFNELPQLEAPEGSMLFDYADEEVEAPSRTLGQAADFTTTYDDYDGDDEYEPPNEEDEILRMDHLMVLSDIVAEEMTEFEQPTQEEREITEEDSLPAARNTWDDLDSEIADDHVVDIAQDIDSYSYLDREYSEELLKKRYREE
jgi:hypothetical protein